VSNVTELQTSHPFARRFCGVRFFAVWKSNKLSNCIILGATLEHSEENRDVKLTKAMCFFVFHYTIPCYWMLLRQK